MKTVITLFLLCCVSLCNAQFFFAGIDYIPRPMYDDFNMSKIEVRFGYVFDDTENSLLNLSYSQGRREDIIDNFPFTWDYHLLKFTYGTWHRIKNGRNARVASVSFFLAPTRYTWTYRYQDHFGFIYEEPYLASRINYGIEFNYSRYWRIAGPVYLKAGTGIVITPQINGPFKDVPARYNLGPSNVPGGGSLPLVNLLLNVGIFTVIK